MTQSTVTRAQDPVHRAPCRWEWVLKYSRTLILLSLLADQTSPAPGNRPPKSPLKPTETVQQSYCWNEYEDIPSRSHAAPVIVRGLCTVIYTRGTLTQFNATFSITDVIKSSPELRKHLQNKAVQLNFGLIEDWTVFPENSQDINTENLLRGQSCSIARVALQQEYLLFLQPHESTDSAQNHVSTGDGGVLWSIFAAPELASDAAVALVQKGLRQAKRAVVSKFRRSVVTVKHGQPLSLQCRVKGFPRPKIHWYKDGINLEQHRRKDIIIRRRKKRTSTLRIKKARPEDAGKYRCVAVNVVGSSQSEAVVTVMTDLAESTTISNLSTHWVFQGVPCPDRGFCFNEGTCRFYPRLMVRSCSCPSGYEGPRCENHVIDHGANKHPDDLPATTNAFQILALSSNILIILLLIALLFYAIRIHRVLTSAYNNPAARSVGSLYPGLTRQYSADSRNQDQLNVRLDYQLTRGHTGNHSTVDERENLLTVNHQTTVDSSHLKIFRPESRAKKVGKHGGGATTEFTSTPHPAKGPWKWSSPKWPAPSTAIALGAPRSTQSAPVVPPASDQISASNLTNPSARPVGIDPLSVPPAYVEPKNGHTVAPTAQPETDVTDSS